MATLAPGIRLGPYEITAKLGEGGMGQVFQAKDFQLGRNVALKVLPEGFASDPERLQRFEREAKLLAQLNHPNIAQIYGFEASGDTRALVMELVEGPTLAERLEQGAFSLIESLSVSLQIALALEEAHEKGIVHRDLKPQNIKASSEGKVKVLDFGLAKAMDPAGSSAALAADLAHSPTVTFGGTREGVILGTAAYMSPEQARGGAVDKRADIWAFGVVLYEMLTGERLFAEGSVVDTLSAVMRKEIDFARLPPATPRELRRLVRRCLERDPKRRLRDIGEARLALEELLAGRGDDEGAPVAPAVHREALSPGRRAVFAAGAVAALAIAAILGWLLRGGSAETVKPSFRFKKLTFLPGVEWAPELSADGKTLYFAAGDAEQSALYSVPVGGKKPTLLTPEVLAFHDSPRLSPDGSQLVFASSRDGGGIFLMGVNGESVRKLADAGNDPAWSPDGRSIVYSTEEFFLPNDGIDGGTLGVVDVATGSARPLTTGDGHQPIWSPSGTRIAYWSLPEGSGNREIWTIGADGGSPAAVASHPAVDWNPVWSEDGRHLYFLSDRGGAMNLWRVAIDETNGRQLGAPESVPLPADEVIYLARSGRRWVYSTLSSRSLVERLEFDPARSALVGAPRPLLSTTSSIRNVRVSPDGKRLAYTTVRPQEDLYVVSLDSGAPTQLTDDPEFDRFPSWTPDSGRIVFASNRGEKYEMWAIRFDGSGLQALTRTNFDSGWSPALSPRGDQLAVSLAQGTAIFDASGPPPWNRLERIPLPESLPGANFSGDLWSPSGDLLAGEVYRGNEPRRVGVLDVAARTYRLFEPSSLPIEWFPDGRRLLVAYRRSLAVLDLSTWKTAPVSGSPQLRGPVSASGDLRTLVTLVREREADVWLAEEASAP